MPFSPTTWADNAAGATPITAAQLNRIETGVALAVGISEGTSATFTATANKFLASPNGSTGAPTYRAIVAADVPALGLAQGALGITTYAQGNLLYASATDTPAKLAIGSAGFMLASTGTLPAWQSRVTLRLTADNTAIAAGTTPAAVATLNQAVNANEEWDVEWLVDVVTSVATDVLIASVTASAGTCTGTVTIEGVSGAVATGAGVAKTISLPIGTALAGSANCPGNSGSTTVSTPLRVRARFKQTVASATVSLNLRAVTSAAATSGTATVKTQSQMIARRIA